jgi:outer membrane usher protein
MPLAGKVQVKWGEGPTPAAWPIISLPPESQQQALSQLSAVCR